MPDRIATVRVRADRVHALAESRALQHEPADHVNDRRHPDDILNGEPDEQVGKRARVKIVGEGDRQRDLRPAALPERPDNQRNVGDRLSLSDDQSEAPGDHQHPERNDERRNPRLRHDKADEQAEYGPNKERGDESERDDPPGMIAGARRRNPSDHDPAGDGRRQSNHGPDRNVELTRDHDDCHPGGDDEHDRHLTEQIADVHWRQETIVCDLHNDDQDRKNAERLNKAVGALEAREKAGGADQTLRIWRGDRRHAAAA